MSQVRTLSRSTYSGNTTTPSANKNCTNISAHTTLSILIYHLIRTRIANLIIRLVQQQILFHKRIKRVKIHIVFCHECLIIFLNKLFDLVHRQIRIHKESQEALHFFGKQGFLASTFRVMVLLQEKAELALIFLVKLRFSVHLLGVCLNLLEHTEGDLRTSLNRFLRRLRAQDLPYVSYQDMV